MAAEGRVAPRGNGAARRVGQLEREEEAGPGAAGALAASPAEGCVLAAQQSAQEVHPHGRGAVADVVSVARQLGVARQLRAVRELGAPADVPDGLLLGAASGPGDSGDGESRVGLEASSAPSAIASATSGDTAPCFSISSASTPSRSVFASFA